MLTKDIDMSAAGLKRIGETIFDLFLYISKETFKSRFPSSHFQPLI